MVEVKTEPEEVNPHNRMVISSPSAVAISLEQERQLDDKDELPEWRYALAKEGTIEGNGSNRDTPLPTGCKDTVNPRVFQPPLVIRMSQLVGRDRMSTVISTLCAKLNDERVHARPGRKPEAWTRLHPWAFIEFVIMIIEDGIDKDGLEKIHKVVAAAAKYLEERSENLGIAAAITRVRQLRMSAKESEFVTRLAPVVKSQKERKNAFWQFEHLVQNVLVVDSFIKLEKAIKRRPKGLLTK